MEKLKVGDKVFVKKTHAWCGVSYFLSEVDRLTKTMAVLKNGIKLINEPKVSSWGTGIERIVYEKYGDRYEKWHIPSESDINELEQFTYQQKIIRWYNDNKDKFSFEQIERIYKNETIQN